MANIKAHGKQCNRTAQFTGGPGWRALESSDVLSRRFPNLDREFLFNRVVHPNYDVLQAPGQSDWASRGCHDG